MARFRSFALDRSPCRLLSPRLWLVAQAPRRPGAAAGPLDAATIDRWMTELSNWNRWGKDDQRGTVNLMTDATRKAAIATVKEGVSVSLSRDADPVKSADNGNPLGLAMVATAQDPDPFAMETLTITFHGSAYTHMDALSHMFHKGQTYNGAPTEPHRRRPAPAATPSPRSSPASSAAAC